MEKDNVELPPPPPVTKLHPRVLIVDDEEINRTLLRDPLEAHGYEVSEAENGPQTLQLVAQQSPDVILLDVMMPGMDGFQVCRLLKQDSRTASIPILMVTALSERKERLLGMKAGASDFLNKPVDLQDLTLRVANAVHTKYLFDQLQAEREKSEQLLLNTLPARIAERIKKGETTIADYHPEVTVLVADVVGFTTLAARIATYEIVFLLNEIFSAFDLLADRYGLEKIKTIGDAYMVAGGIPTYRVDHAQAAADFALDLRLAMTQFNRKFNTSTQLRVGVHSGPVIAGVIGQKKFAYDLWGDTVNVACRLESLAQPGSIQVSDATFERLKHEYHLDAGTIVELRGRGQMKAYTLLGRLDGIARPAESPPNPALAQKNEEAA
jgi:class 3 adenylate cyclase